MHTIRPVVPCQPNYPSAAVVPKPLCTLRMTVDASAVTQLRQLASRICGDALEFIRITACERGRRMKVCLCVGRSLVETVILAIMQGLPNVEFSRFSMSAARH